MRTLDRSTLSCKYERIVIDHVPYGSTTVSMESLDCQYDGDKDMSGEFTCGRGCPAFEPQEVLTCPKHGEYTDYCEQCRYGEEF